MSNSIRHKRQRWGLMAGLLVLVGSLGIYTMSVMTNLSPTATSTSSSSAKADAPASLGVGVLRDHGSATVGALVYDQPRDTLRYLTSGAQGIQLSSVNVATNQTGDVALDTRQTFGLECDLTLAADGSLWAGYNHTLARFQPDGDTVNSVEIPPSASLAFPSSQGPEPVASSQPIRAMSFDDLGWLWLARGRSTGLTGYDPDTGSIIEVPFPNNLGDGRDIVRHPDGSLWITIDNDIRSGHGGPDVFMKFDPVSRQFKVFEYPAESLAISPSGDVYVANYLFAVARDKKPYVGKLEGNIPKVVLTGDFRADVIAIGTDSSLWLNEYSNRSWLRRSLVTNEMRRYRYAQDQASLDLEIISSIQAGAEVQSNNRPAQQALIIRDALTDGDGHLYAVLGSQLVKVD